jgi:transcriptional regulator GlxA family with amidase domain
MIIAVGLYQGFAALDAMGPYEVLTYLPDAEMVIPHTEWTTSVCTGALLLGAAGLLNGLPATTHWSAYDALASYGAQPTEQRVVTAGRIMTGAGVSAGIDLALTLAAKIAGPEVAQRIQLAIEYDPHPPFDAGSPSKAPKPIYDMAVAALGD